jgi:hypothetical protein
MPKRLGLSVLVGIVVFVSRAQAAFLYSAAYLKPVPTTYLSAENSLAFSGIDGARIGKGGMVASQSRYGTSSSTFVCLWKPNGEGIDLHEKVFGSSSYPAADSAVVGFDNNGGVLIRRFGNTLNYAVPAPTRSDPNRWEVRFSFTTSGTFVSGGYGDLNDRGEIVAATTSAAGIYYYNNRTVQLNFYPRRINNNGVIVGGSLYAQVTNGVVSQHAVAAPSGFDYIDLRDINDGGLMVGRVGIGNGSSGTQFLPATYSEQGGVQLLPLLDGFDRGQALAVNAGGDVVGFMIGSDGQYQATLWRGSEVHLLRDLADVGDLVLLSAASGISDDGYIYVQGSAMGEAYGFVLSPLPEPACFALLGFGAIAVLGTRPRRSKRGAYPGWRFAEVACGFFPLAFASAPAQAGVQYSLAYLKDPVPDSNLVSPFDLTTVRSEGVSSARLGRGGVVVGKGQWEISTTNFAAWWAPDGNGVDLHSIGLRSSSTNRTESLSLGVNDNGEVAVYSASRGLYQFTPSPTAPLGWTARVIILPAVVPDGFKPLTTPFDQSDMNNSGVIVLGGADGKGYYITRSPPQPGLPWQGTVLEAPQPLVRVNNHGVAVGGNVFGGYFDGVASFSTVPTPSGFGSISLRDINDDGLMVGYATQGANSRPFVYSEARGFEFLPSPSGFTSGQALGVNADGDVVGYVVGADGVSQAVLWRDGDPLLLRDLANVGSLIRLSTATGISDDGYIYAQAVGFQRVNGIILSPVPEPASCALLGIGCACLLAMRRSRASRAESLAPSSPRA